MDAEESRVEYDPTDPTPPAREPPYRSTAPQSHYTSGQVATGLAIMLLGVVIVVGLTLALA
ncbi:DUF7550 family protein [Halobacteriaceae archaeon SHR40]|uniref:DUF7550 family protein n=1 Tax=Halovenus amylolytica TaxID=2500550 RepID=UPI000FE37789